MADPPVTTATPEDVSSALDAAQDPDVIPAGSQQATTTEEAKEQARKFLGRVGQHEEEATKLRKDIESNAAKSKQALINAQQFLLQNWGVTQPSEQELTQRAMAAWMRPTQGGVYGAGIAQGANLQEELANQSAQQRQAIAGYLQQASGEPLRLQLEAIEAKRQAAQQKLLEMQTKYDAQMGGKALTTLGRMATTPAAQAAMKPLSDPGRRAFDILGQEKAYNIPYKPESGLSPAFHALTKEQNDASIAEAKARAGIDENPLSPEEKVAAANQAGVPAFPIGAQDPLRMSTPQRKQFYQDENKEYIKAQDKMGDEDSARNAALRYLDDFLMRNARTYTGPKIAPWYIGGVHAGPHGAGVDLRQDQGGFNMNPLSWFANWTSDIQEMQKDMSNILPLAIPKSGFGRVTNRDLQLFKDASLGIEKNPDTNKLIAQGLRIRLENDLERNKFIQGYYQVHRQQGGAEYNWQDYLDHNKIFDPRYDPEDAAYDEKLAHSLKPGAIVPLNPHRMDWRTYFRSTNPKVVADEDEGGGEGPGVPQVPPPYPPQPGDTSIAQAGGGRVHMAEGGETPPAQPDPEVREGLNALINGLTFRAAGEPEPSESPATNFLGEAAGASATTLAALAALRRPAATARFMANHPHLTASGIGAITGGLSAGMGGTDPLAGAGAGAILGPGFRIGARGLFDLGANRLDQLRDALTGSERYISPGERKAIGAVEADVGGDWNKVAQRLQADAKMRLPSTLGEIGPRSLGLTRAAMNRDTPESAALLEQLQGRQAAAPERAYDLTNQALAPDNYLMKTQELRNALYTKAAPLYDQAFAAFPSVKTNTLMQIMGTPSGQEAATRAFRMMQDQRLPIGAPDAAGMVQNPSLQYLDQIKRALDDMVIQEEGAGANYQATQQGRILRQMRSQLVDELDKATMGPQGQPSPYRAARDQYAGDLDVMDALRTGRENFDKFTPDELKGLMGKLDYSSRDAFRSGVAEGIFQKIMGTGEGMNAAQRIISNPKLQEKIVSIFDDPKQAQKYIAALQRESAVFGTGKTLTASGLKGQITSMEPRSVSSMMRHSLMRKGTAGDVTETMGLTANDPLAGQKLQRLRDAADRLKMRSSIGNLAGTAGGAGITSAYMPSRLDQNQGPQ